MLQEFRFFEQENARLKKLLVDRELKIDGMKGMMGKSHEAVRAVSVRGRDEMPQRV